MSHDFLKKAEFLYGTDEHKAKIIKLAEKFEPPSVKPYPYACANCTRPVSSALGLHKHQTDSSQAVGVAVCKPRISFESSLSNVHKQNSIKKWIGKRLKRNGTKFVVTSNARSPGHFAIITAWNKNEKGIYWSTSRIINSTKFQVAAPDSEFFDEITRVCTEAGIAEKVKFIADGELFKTPTNAEEVGLLICLKSLIKKLVRFFYELDLTLIEPLRYSSAAFKEFLDPAENKRFANFKAAERSKEVDQVFSKGLFKKIAQAGSPDNLQPIQLACLMYAKLDFASNRSHDYSIFKLVLPRLTTFLDRWFIVNSAKIPFHSGFVASLRAWAKVEMDDLPPVAYTIAINYCIDAKSIDKLELTTVKRMSFKCSNHISRSNIIFELEFTEDDVKYIRGTGFTTGQLPKHSSLYFPRNTPQTTAFHDHETLTRFMAINKKIIATFEEEICALV